MKTTTTITKQLLREEGFTDFLSGMALQAAFDGLSRLDDGEQLALLLEVRDYPEIFLEDTVLGRLAMEFIAEYAAEIETKTSTNAIQHEKDAVD